MISHRHQCIFVHIPKCGGSSVEEILWPEPRHVHDLWMGFLDRYHNKYQTGGLQHLLARQIRQEVGPHVFDAYFKFAFVRDPFDKAVSQYHYMRGRDDLREFIGMRQDDSFKTYLRLTRQRVHVQWEEQWKFVLDERGRPMMDFVGRFESFEADVRRVLDRLSVAAPTIPHTNRTERGRYEDYYDDEAAAIVASMYHRDLDLFGYAFAGGTGATTSAARPPLPAPATSSWDSAAG